MRKLLKTGMVATGAVAATAVVACRPEARRGLRRARARMGRETRHLRGVADGAWYRLRGGHPDPDVSDDILTQRVRSELGPLEKQLDLPHVHVAVEEHMAVLHGEVGSSDDVARIELAVLHVPGVRSVESYLHVGFSDGTRRPSTGRLEAQLHPSAARTALLGPARAAGIAEADVVRVTRAVLGAFTSRIPRDEREQLLGHLPADARGLAGPARHHGAGEPRVRTTAHLVAEVSEAGRIDPELANTVTAEVVAALRSLVPEEADDVAAVLPAELEALWGARADH